MVLYGLNRLAVLFPMIHLFHSLKIKLDIFLLTVIKSTTLHISGYATMHLYKDLCNKTSVYIHI